MAQVVGSLQLSWQTWFPVAGFRALDMRGGDGVDQQVGILSCPTTSQINKYNCMRKQITSGYGSQEPDASCRSHAVLLGETKVACPAVCSPDTASRC